MSQDDNQTKDSATDELFNDFTNPIYKKNFIAAIDSDDLTKFRQCLSDGAPAFLTKVSGAGMRPLDTVCSFAGQQALEMVKILVEEYNAPTNGEALAFAAMKGKIPIMEYLVQHGANVNYVGEDSYTALHCAAESKQIEAYDWLIDHDADVNARLEPIYDDYDSDDEGYAPTAAELLADASSDANNENKDSKIEWNFADFAQYLNQELMNHKPVPESESPSTIFYTKTCKAVFRAIEKNDLEAFRAGLNALAEIEDPKYDYSDALFQVCYVNPSQVIEMARILVEEYNASVTFRYGEAFGCAAEHSNIQLMDYLVNHGANVNQADDGWTILHAAAQCANYDAYHWLVEHGANEQAKYTSFDDRIGKQVECTAAEILEQITRSENKRKRKEREHNANDN